MRRLLPCAMTMNEYENLRLARLFSCANVVRNRQKKIATNYQLIDCDLIVLPWKGNFSETS